LIACGTSRKKQVKGNNPVLYNPASSSLHPQMGVFHISDEESQLYIMLNTNELIVNEANADHLPKADIRIHYRLFDCTEIDNNKAVSDSATFINSIQVYSQQKTVVFPIPIPALQGRRYILLAQITDLLRRNTVRQFVTIDKTNTFSEQNFRITAMNGTPKLGKTVSESDIFRIICRQQSISHIFIKYMSAPQEVSTSPLSPYPAPALHFTPDTVWEQPYSPTTNFLFTREGLYLIQIDTLQQEGMLLMNFGNAYPKENQTAQLVTPIRYLMSATEYQKLQAAGHPKKMMDDFWLAVTGSTDKARMLIRVFYTRMSYANQYFTDVKEGWKTDRGMVYMVYGLPDNVLKSFDSETWEYNRSSRQAGTVTFIFDRKPTNYGGDYYVLRRNSPQSTYWSQAVDSWRNGRVFSLSEIE
jgi:GWxTD domain-containing protein